MKKRFRQSLLLLTLSVAVTVFARVDAESESIESSTKGLVSMLDISQIDFGDADTKESSKSAESDENYTLKFPNIFDIFRSIF